MPAVNGAEIKARAARLRDKAALALSAHLDGMIGRIDDVLVEKPNFARAGNFASIRLAENSAPRAGALVNVEISGHDGRQLIGTLV